jgi:ubiquinone biosynthesis protein Coq4
MRNPVHIAELVLSFVRLTADLDRLDRVFAINETLMKLRSRRDTARVLDELRASPTAARALEARHRLGVLDPDALAAMAPETLGGAYGRFMVARDLRPESLPDRYDGSDMDYLLAHFYETHDLWHVVTGFDTDPAGEAGLQAFYLAQQRSYLPFFVISAILLNTAIYAYEDKHARLDAIAEGWRLGKQARCLVGLDWRPLLERDLERVREDLGLPARASSMAVAS